MSEIDENNVLLGKAPLGFSTLQPMEGSSRPLVDKGKSVEETPLPNIFEAL